MRFSAVQRQSAAVCLNIPTPPEPTATSSWCAGTLEGVAREPEVLIQDLALAGQVLGLSSTAALTMN
jgi:hypothetical protein